MRGCSIKSISLEQIGILKKSDDVLIFDVNDNFIEKKNMKMLNDVME